MDGNFNRWWLHLLFLVSRLQIVKINLEDSYYPIPFPAAARGLPRVDNLMSFLQFFLSNFLNTFFPIGCGASLLLRGGDNLSRAFLLPFMIPP